MVWGSPAPTPSTLMQRLMRPTRVKPPNTNTLTTTQLKRGCATRLILCQWRPNKRLKEPRAREEVKYQVESAPDNGAEVAQVSIEEAKSEYRQFGQKRR